MKNLPLIVTPLRLVLLLLGANNRLYYYFTPPPFPLKFSFFPHSYKTSWQFVLLLVSLFPLTRFILLPLSSGRRREKLFGLSLNFESPYGILALESPNSLPSEYFSRQSCWFLRVALWGFEWLSFSLLFISWAENCRETFLTIGRNRYKEFIYFREV